MIDKNLLEDMARVELKNVAPERLRDILEVEISGENADRRLENYLAQVGNPYCFRVGNTPVRISFKSCEKTLGERIKSYFSGLKS